MPRQSATPPITELRAFEAAARLRSISAAALELGCSQPCISHRIRSLEERWSTVLLDRTTRTVSWTIVTERTYGRVKRLLEDLDSLVETFDPVALSTELAITVSPGFASAWLVPRLTRFLTLHPGIQVTLSATNRIVDLAHEKFDVAIRLIEDGDPIDPGLVATKISDSCLVVVAGAALAATLPSPLPVADLLQSRLIGEDDDDYWEKFFGSTGPAVKALQKSMRYNNSDLVIKAAIDNQGIALVRRFAVAREIAAGRLAQIVDQTGESGDAYYLASTRSKASRPAVQRFRNWMLEEMDADSVGR
jgi:LysR family glycine cleavage system transcriptional activator